MRQRLACLLLVLTLALIGHGRAVAGDFSLDALDFGSDSGTGFPGIELAEKPLLTATLTPETPGIVPGRPFFLLLSLDHVPGHYSYWTNPGGPGIGTQVAWTLPEGFAISQAAWPAPQRYANGPIISYIYKGRVNILYRVEVPVTLRPGEEAVISGDFTAQACTARTCNPVRQTLTLSLVASDEEGTPNPLVLAANAVLPKAPEGWRFEAAIIDNELVIAMTPPEESVGDPGDVYFFDATLPEPMVDSQRPQVLEKKGDHWLLRAPLRGGAASPAEKLAGIITATDGWRENGEGRPAFLLELSLPGTGETLSPALRRAAPQTLVLLLFAFLGGFLLNVMPCVFPVIGLKIMGFAKQAHKDRRAVFLHGLAYTAGVLICFWTLSFLVITMGRGWGAQLQSDWFMFALCHVFMIMSMNMAGVFDVGSSMAGAGNALTGREGLKRSFFTGLLATITSTPCSAPFLGTALAYALSLPALMSLGVFTLMGLGFAFPYLALSLFPNWLKKLPKPGPWMDTFRQAMCFPLFGTTAYLFWTMEAMLDEWHFLMLLFGLVLTAMACWLYGKHQRTGLKRPRISKMLLAFAAVSLIAGLWLGHPKTGGELKWTEWSPEIVARLREEGRPVYVDFTARWCATCQLNKRVYQDPDVMQLIADKNVALLKADWTQYDDRITLTLKTEFNKAAVPVTVLYAPGESAGTVLPDILTVGNVSDAIRDLPDRVTAKR